MPDKKFRTTADAFKQVIDKENDGVCIASDRITVDGCPVGYMYRETPENDHDTGWRFLAGDESDEYMDEADNHSFCAVNTIANYDSDIIPLLGDAVGAGFLRNPVSGRFEAMKAILDLDYLSPEYPVVIGECDISERWSVTLPIGFNHNVEDDTVLLWRVGITMMVNVWLNDPRETIDERLAQLQAGTAADAFEQQVQTMGTLQHYSYRLTEDEEQALIGFVISEEELLQLDIYFDDEADIDLARSILASVKEHPG